MPQEVLDIEQTAHINKALGSYVFPTGEVISSVSELQNLNVNPSAEKEKQQSEAKHILMQKHRALSDLFKHLAKIGKGSFWNTRK